MNVIHVWDPFIPVIVFEKPFRANEPSISPTEQFFLLRNRENTYFKLLRSSLGSHMTRRNGN